MAGDHTQSVVEQEEETDICGLKNEVYETFDLLEAFTTPIQTAVSCARFSASLDKSDISFKLEWLRSVKCIVDSLKNENLETVFSLVSALFLMSPEDLLLGTTLETLESILVKAPHLVSVGFLFDIDI